MKVSKHGKTFEIKGVTNSAEAARFLRQNGFKIFDNGQTRVAEQPDAPVHAEQGGESSEAKCTTERLCPVHNFWHAPRPTRSAGG